VIGYTYTMGPQSKIPASTMASGRPSSFRVWATAARPHTLSASIIPVIVGHSFAFYVDPRPIMPVPLSTISVAFASFACLIQLGTNLHNDYADFVSKINSIHFLVVLHPRGPIFSKLMTHPAKQRARTRTSAWDRPERPSAAG